MFVVLLSVTKSGWVEAAREARPPRRRSERAASRGGAFAAERAMDRPDETAQFAGDRDDRDVLQLASFDQRPIARGEPRLRLPGDLLDCGRRRLDPLNLAG